MAIDIHAHHIPSRVMQRLQQEGSDCGVEIAASGSEGPQLRLGQGSAPGRPIIKELLDLEDRENKLKEQNLQHQLLSTWLDIVGYNLPVEQGCRWSRLLNRCLAEELKQQKPERHFTGVATVPLQSGERAAEELEFAVKECGMLGVTIGTHVNGKNLDDPSLRPFWRMAEQLKTPIIIHPFFPLGLERLGSYFLTHIVGLTAETTLAAASLYCGGVIDQFPGLKIVLCHGGGFFPYQVGRLERGREIRDDIKKATRRMAREALGWFYYDTILFDAKILEFLISEAGANHILLGSDCPFGIGDPDPTRIVSQTRISGSDKEMILSGNALQLFQIK
ncbi:MAG: amidohydrolase [Deltaproteobacteria bacterium]|nr:amidohydrolase [Deltaproteobacteria bacterium]MBI2348195.1 amidohydrolase [Deltaproteobacteria bacterium]MBI2538848.1 amidohydrolase [Deltaproteobacteria bacterium]MBI3060499.1 amidohydrolase [Deltaproteobacteria bacterium]